MRLSDNRGGKHPYGIKGVLRLKARIEEEINKKPPFGPQDLAIDGHDLMELGLKEGPALGAVLGMLVERTLDDPELNTREQLLALAQEIVENPKAVEAAIASRRRGRDSENGEAPGGSDDKGQIPGKSRKARIQGR